MPAASLAFDDSAGYERFMGRWSRAVAPVFLNWLCPPRHARCLDVGCGTGILTEVLLQLCAPESINAVDCAEQQVEAAAHRLHANGVAFQVADACKLPFPDASFDVVASGLVVNFIADRTAAVAEMRRVARPGGVLAAYVWDFTEELSPSGPLRRSMRRVGAEVPAIPGAEASRTQALLSLFEQAGLERSEARTIDVCLAYSDFDDFWTAQTPGYAPTTQVIAAMKPGKRARLMRALRASIPCGPNGSIAYFARANAIKARVPSIQTGTSLT